jgi:hypothetical protein
MNEEAPLAAQLKRPDRKKAQLLAAARKESRALAPIVKRALAKHGKAGQQVYVVVGDGEARWVRVSTRGNVKEAASRPYTAHRTAAPARKK